jgi:hypothetical protein
MNATRNCMTKGLLEQNMKEYTLIIPAKQALSGLERQQNKRNRRTTQKSKR